MAKWNTTLLVYVTALISIGTPHAFCMDIDQAALEKQVQNVIGSSPNSFLTAMPDFIQDMASSGQETVEQVKETVINFEKERKWAKWQNTVLLGHPKVPIALYRRDLIELPFFAADLYIAWYFFQTFKTKRIDYLYAVMTEHAEAYIPKLIELQQEKRVFNAELAAAVDAEDRIRIRNKFHNKVVAILSSIGQDQLFLGDKPLKRDLFLPFLATFTGLMASGYLQNKLLVKQSFSPEAHFAYKPDGSPFELDPMYHPSRQGINEGLEKLNSYTSTYRIRNKHGDWVGDPIDGAMFRGLTHEQILEKYPNVCEILEKRTAQPNMMYAQYKRDGYDPATCNDQLVEERTSAQSNSDLADKIGGLGKLAVQGFKYLYFWHQTPLALTTLSDRYYASNPNAPRRDFGLPITQALNTALDPIIPEGSIRRSLYSIIGLPSWVYSLLNNPVARCIIEFAILRACVYVTDEFYNNRWFIHIATECDTLLELLKGYQSTKHLPDTDTDKQRVAHELRKFVVKGNSIYVSNIKESVSQFFEIKYWGRKRIDNSIGAWIFTASNIMISYQLLRYLLPMTPMIFQAFKSGVLRPSDFDVGPDGIKLMIYFSSFLMMYGIGVAVMIANQASFLYGIGKRVVTTVKDRLTKKKRQRKQQTQETTQTSNTIPTH